MSSTRSGAANAADVDAAAGRGRSTTRLELTPVDAGRAWSTGLRGWAASELRRDQPRRDRRARRMERRGSDARRSASSGSCSRAGRTCSPTPSGCCAPGNTVVFRIGSDALGTARAIIAHARRTGAVARRSAGGRRAPRRVGRARRRLGAVLRPAPVAGRRPRVGAGGRPARRGGAAGRRAGQPARHGRGVDRRRPRRRRRPLRRQRHALARPQGVQHAQRVLHRPRARAAELVPALRRRGQARRGRARQPTPASTPARARSAHRRPTIERRDRVVRRADGAARGPFVTPIASSSSATNGSGSTRRRSPLHVVETVAEAVALHNRLSPHFIASLISESVDEHDRFFATVDAPFVGDGFTRWVDGQYALGTPELGLSNWEHGRLLGRGGILSGDGVHTVRYRAQRRRPRAPPLTSAAACRRPVRSRRR